MSKEYSCCIYFAGHVEVLVDAEDEHAAYDKALEQFDFIDVREIEAGIEEVDVQDVECEEDRFG